MKRLIGALTIPLLTSAACATTGPSKELVDARQAYEEARTSKAAEYRPDAVLSAQQALERAEQAHHEDPQSFRERSLAYVAERTSQKAMAWGDYEADLRALEQAEEDYKAKQAKLLSAAERDRQQVAESLDSTQQRLEAQEQSLNKTQAELAQERAAREAAEQQARAAIQSLEQVAQIKEEARGMVITLSGAVLFLTGKSELLPIAKRKLDDVAKALKDMQPNQKIVVEGHTDSRGTDENNMELSRQRAEAVRNYLVEQGVQPDRISAVGRGEAQPIATNDSAAGRANNRRVEIVIPPANSHAATPASSAAEGG